MNTITLPSNLKGFTNTNTKENITQTNRHIYLIDGNLEERDLICTDCGNKMHIHDTYNVSLNHLQFGPDLCLVRFPKHRYYCQRCKATQMEEVAFQSEGHRITTPLLNFTKGLLHQGLTLKMVSHLTGLGKNVVKAIDKERLQRLYCKENSTEWRVPE